MVQLNFLTKTSSATAQQLKKGVTDIKNSNRQWALSDDVHTWRECRWCCQTKTTNSTPWLEVELAKSRSYVAGRQLPSSKTPPDEHSTSHHSCDWLCLDMLSICSQWFLRLLFSQPALLQVTTLLLNLAGVTHVVDAASAGYTKSVYWSQPSGFWRFEPWSNLMSSSCNGFRTMQYMTIIIKIIIIIIIIIILGTSRFWCLGYLCPHNPQGRNVAVPALF